MENKKPKAEVKEKPFRRNVLNAILDEFKDDVKVVYSSDDRAIIKPLKLVAFFIYINLFNRKYQ